MIDELKDLIGKHVLSGIDLGREECKSCWGGLDTRNYVLITLDGINYKIVEDPDDGYRSYCGEIFEVDDVPKTKLPDVNVVCVPREGLDKNIIDFIDIENCKRILSIGTDYWDNYYPMCVFEYIPENLSCNAAVNESENFLERPSMKRLLDLKKKELDDYWDKLKQQELEKAKDECKTVIIDGEELEYCDNSTYGLSDKADTNVFKPCNIDGDVDISKELELLKQRVPTEDTYD